MNQKSSRRKFLGTAGATIGSLLAGCNSDDSTERTDTGTDGINQTLEGNGSDPNLVSEDSVFVEEGETVAVGNSEETYIFTVTEVEDSSYAKMRVHNDVTVDAIEGEQFDYLLMIWKQKMLLVLAKRLLKNLRE